jgi:hypothetical protein
MWWTLPLKGEIQMLVTNLFGGPGIGKSTLAAGIFSLLKLHGVNAELVTEFAKDLTWEERHKTLTNQYYVWGKQYHRMWRLRDDVDIIVTDSPLLLSLIYGETCPPFHQTVIETYHSTFKNLNYFLRRIKPYNPKGRNQDLEEAKNIDINIKNMLIKHNIDFKTVPGDTSGINSIVKDVLDVLQIESKYNLKGEK